MAKLAVAFKTDTGSIPGKSEDAFLVEDNLFIIAEGVGGEYLDEIAKEMACRVIRNVFFARLKEMQSPSDALLYAMKEANREILREGKKIGQKMAASVGVVYVRDTIVYFAHLGDCRIYCLQKGEIVQLTRDHTVGKEDPPGLPKSRDVRHKSVLKEALGLRVSPPVEVKKFALHEKDLILMTTEGLTGRLSDLQIQKISLKSTNVKKLCGQLIHEARRIDRNRTMTLGLIRLDRKVPLRRNLILSYSGLVFVCVALIAFYWREHGWQDPSNEEVRVTQTVSEANAKEQETYSMPEKKEASPTTLQEPLPAPSEPPSSPEFEKESERQASEKEIRAFVAAWERAWEKSAGQKGDMESYMSFYSKSFSSGGGTKAAWKRDKKRKNRKKHWIRLELRDIRIKESSADPRVEVRFRQIYKSSNFSINSRKKLVIRREGSDWKILHEETY